MKVQKLKLDKKFQPCLADENDEIFQTDSSSLTSQK